MSHEIDYPFPCEALIHAGQHVLCDEVAQVELRGALVCEGCAKLWEHDQTRLTLLPRSWTDRRMMVLDVLAQFFTIVP